MFVLGFSLYKGIDSINGPEVLVQNGHLDVG